MKRSIIAFSLVFVFCFFLSYNSFALKPDRISPTAPSNLRVVSLTDNYITLTWNASTDNLAVKSYDIYRDGVYIGNSVTTTYTNSGLTPGKLYKYFVKAKDAAGNVSNASNTVNATTLQSTAAVSTFTLIPTSTPTPEPIFTPEPTNTYTPAATFTIEPTLTPTSTPTHEPTPQPVSTFTPTLEATSTPVPAFTSTCTPTQTSTSLPTSTSTITPAPTSTPTSTPTLQPAPTPTTVTKTSKVIGYYAAWAAYSGFTPDKIDAGKLTHINYAFANIGSDLKIAMGYPDIDPSNFSKLNALKKAYPNLKTMISVGGWSWSGKFSDAALTDASRTVFADSCVAFIVQYGFDGVDIDWEYPVSGGDPANIKRPEDKHNFTLLLQKLRERLNSRSQIDGKTYLLTIAGGCGSGYVNNVELSILQQYLDYGNIMTYDIHGTWDAYTDFNSPLYNNSDTSPQYKWSVDSGVNTWLKAGFPIEKLVIGVPFYGYKYTMVKNSNNGLYQVYSGGSSITYTNIASNYLNAPGYLRYYHQQSMVPWLFNGSTFITYEDEQSMGAKAQYIKTKGAGGAMIWELSQDHNGVLLNSLYKGLQ